jgi:NADH-quinone oxidoreductase subunit A
MLFEFTNIFIAILLSVFFVFFMLFASKILRPKADNPIKLSTYECGEEPVGEAWNRFNFRYYILALLFVVFDVEIAFVYPCATVFKKWVLAGNGMIVFLELFFFMAILLLALVYAWRKEDLEWFKGITSAKRGDK